MMSIAKFAAAAVVVTGTMLSLTLPASANLVVNGGFEADTPPSGGAPQGWTLTGAGEDSDFFVGAGPGFGAFAGSNSANFGATGSTDDVLSQLLSTTPGQSYTISFQLAHDSSDALNDFSVLFGGTTLLSLLNQDSFGYTFYTFTGTAASASTLLAFHGREVPAWYDLDAVDVELAGATGVPEPATLALFGAGLLCAAMMRRWQVARARVICVSWRR